MSIFRQDEKEVEPVSWFFLYIDDESGVTAVGKEQEMLDRAAKLTDNGHRVRIYKTTAGGEDKLVMFDSQTIEEDN